MASKESERMFARILMLEHLMEQVLLMAANNYPDPRAAIEGLRRRTLEGLKTATLPGSTDAIQSDSMMQTVEEVTDELYQRLLSRIPS